MIEIKTLPISPKKVDKHPKSPQIQPNKHKKRLFSENLYNKAEYFYESVFFFFFFFFFWQEKTQTSSKNVQPYYTRFCCMNELFIYTLYDKNYSFLRNCVYFFTRICYSQVMRRKLRVIWRLYTHETRV